MATDPQTLNRETDTRFWAIAGYAPGHKLDPNNAVDALMVPVWRAIYDVVATQAQNGTLQTTFDHPAIAQAIDDATSHASAVQHALDKALAAPAGSPPHAQAIATAGAHHDAAQMTTKAAGAALPAPVVTAMAPALAPVASSLVHATNVIAQSPPPVTSTADAHKIMQATAAPKHAVDVAKAHGLNFQMDASGHGVLVGPSAGGPSVSVTPADLPTGGGGSARDSAPAPMPDTGPAPTGAKPSTPWLALGAVAAALGAGALIVNNTPGKRRYRRNYDRRGYARP
jgi:hypothetical protein